MFNASYVKLGFHKLFSYVEVLNLPLEEFRSPEGMWRLAEWMWREVNLKHRRNVVVFGEIGNYYFLADRNVNN